MLTYLTSILMGFTTPVGKHFRWHPVGSPNPCRTFINLTLKDSCNPKIADLQPALFMYQYVCGCKYKNSLVLPVPSFNCYQVLIAAYFIILDRIDALLTFHISVNYSRFMYSSQSSCKFPSNPNNESFCKFVTGGSHLRDWSATDALCVLQAG